MTATAQVTYGAWPSIAARVMLTAALCVSSAAVLAVPPRNLLVLCSNSRLLPGIVAADRGLRDVLADASAPPIRLFSEFLDSPEFGGEAYERTVASISPIKGRWGLAAQCIPRLHPALTEYV